jgi:hypothetical protein
MRIGIVLMLIRVRIWIGINMEIGIRIGIKTMSIHTHTGFQDRGSSRLRAPTGLASYRTRSTSWSPLRKPFTERRHHYSRPVLRIRDPLPFWPLESGMGKKLRSGSGMNILDHISESLETIFWVKIVKFYDADPDPGTGIFLTLIFFTLDPESFWLWIRDGKYSDPVSGINIPDPQHCILLLHL